MTKSEFSDLYIQIIDRVKNETTQNMKEQISILENNNDSMEDVIAKVTAEAMACSISAAAQIVYDTVLSLNLLEND